MGIRPTGLGIATRGRVIAAGLLGNETLPEESPGVGGGAIADFAEVQFPALISRGAKGGPMFKTSVSVVNSGASQRVALWNDPIWRWDVGIGAQTRDQMQEVIEFFIARMGKLQGFRFKDWQDYRVTDQTMQNISGDLWQIVKRYTSGSVTKIRRIRKPIDGTLSITDHVGVPISALEYTVDYTKGTVLFTLGPVVNPRATCEFDTPVRFDTDSIDYTQDDIDARSWDGIHVVELKF
jgi:uncharacterized protein (TIGR02217 family)